MNQIEAVERLRFLKRYQWLCSDLKCNGKPHAGMPYPHARASQRVNPEPYIFCWITGRGFGKLLRMSTPIPTPSGWTPISDLRVGDRVFDEAGQPCSVTAVFDEMPERVYKLNFSDGSSIIAGGEHQWVTWTAADRKALNRCLTHNQRTGFPENWPTWRASGRWGYRVDAKGPSVRTTDEIVASLTTGKRGDTNHSIPNTLPLQLPEEILPVDPWLLGFWLGDGSTKSGELTIGSEDYDFIASQTVLSHNYEKREGFAGRYNVPGLATQLRYIGVLGNKHVPNLYLRASEQQRRELLAGLLDSDGYIDPISGHVEFTSELEILAENVAELARSLGMKPVVAKSRATLNGMDCGPKWRVTWRPLVNCFRLPRKAAQFQPLESQALRNFHRMIVSVEELPIEPMRCITVDSSHSIYLAGEGMIPTHNTRAAAEYCKQRMLDDPGHRVNVVVPISSVGKLVCVEGESGMLAITPPDRIANWSRSLGELTFKNGSMLKIYGAHSRDDAETIRGSQSNTLWAEELATWREQELAWNMASLANRLPGAKVVVTSTPKSTPLIRKLFKMDNALITGGSTFENQENLAPEFINHLLQSYQGTRLGQQELEGVLLNDVTGALWTRDMIRVADKAPELVRICVAVDPPGGHRIGSNAKCGIVAVGKAEDGLLYVLADRSDFMSPEQWSRAAINLYDELEADCIVAEINYGGTMVESVLRTAGMHSRFKMVHASRGKAQRAEPVVSLYEKKKVLHVGLLEELENQMTSWVPKGQVETDADGIESPIPASDYSPDAVDALVWAITELALQPRRRRSFMSFKPTVGAKW